MFGRLGNIRPMSTLAPNVQHLINQIPGTVGIKTPDSVFLAGNAEFAKTCALKHPEDFAGISPYDLCHTSEEAQQFIEEDQLVTTTRETLSNIGLEKSRDGEYRLIIGNKKPYYNEKNELIGVLGHGTILEKQLILPFLKLLNTSKPISSITNKRFRHVEQYNTSNIKLTKRESEILFFLMHGKSTKELASMLNISTRTIESHIANLKDKFQCRLKSGLIEASIDAGLYQIIPTHLLSCWIPN